MNREELLRFFSGHANSLETAQWLRGTYMPRIIELLNRPIMRRSLGLYQGERIPDNERNLTDVRNRVSLLIENELARLSNQILETSDINDLFWSYVVANRFPDLEIRHRDGTRHMRIEVKCLQSVAEEKSANFDTLKKDINPEYDFVVVFLWEWAYDGTDFLWDRAPKLQECFVFHAYSLAELRDQYWLNKPPGDLGDGYQGFDLRFPVNCNNGVYAQEEGNYGKLLRIWKKGFLYRPQESSVMLDTETEYLRFQEKVLIQGFWSLCEYHLPRLSEGRTMSRIIRDGRTVGAKSGQFGFFSRALLDSKNILPLMLENEVNYGVVMTDKYVSTGYRINDEQLEQLFKGLKPKLLSRAHFGLV
jgi:hypothetical protein